MKESNTSTYLQGKQLQTKLSIPKKAHTLNSWRFSLKKAVEKQRYVKYKTKCYVGIATKAWRNVSLQLFKNNSGGNKTINDPN